MTHVNHDGSRRDDWDHHWDQFGDVALRNPANQYRHAMVLKLLGDVGPGSVMLDVGSGQGQFALDFQEAHPQARVLGVEHSAEGVRRGNEAAERRGLPVSFFQRDLLEPVTALADEPLATHAVCSEVLEHVTDPVALVRNTRSLLAEGARVVFTVPGGPRSAFDRHIGHERHFTAEDLREVLTAGGLQVDRVLRTGFPGFNLYKLSVIARGERLVRDVEARGEPTNSRLEEIASSVFRRIFRLNRDDSRFGWQLAAVATVPTTGRGGGPC